MSLLQQCLLSSKTKRMSEQTNMRVNGLQGTSSCGAGESITCCPATVEVEQVKKKKSICRNLGSRNTKYFFPFTATVAMCLDGTVQGEY